MVLSPQLLAEASALLPLSASTCSSPPTLQGLMLARVRRRLGITTPLVMAVPDYGVPASGYYPAAGRAPARRAGGDGDEPAEVQSLSETPSDR